MKKIKRLTLSEIKVGNEYGLVYRFSCEPMGRVKILEVGNDTILVQSSSYPDGFEVDLLWYSMFKTYKDSFITHEEVLVFRLWEVHYLLDHLSDPDRPIPYLYGRLAHRYQDYLLES